MFIAQRWRFWGWFIIGKPPRYRRQVIKLAIWGIELGRQPSLQLIVVMIMKIGDGDVHDQGGDGQVHDHGPSHNDLLDHHFLDSWNSFHLIWMTGWWLPPLWKIFVSWDYYSQCMRKKNVPKYQPDDKIDEYDHTIMMPISLKWFPMRIFPKLPQPPPAQTVQEHTSVRAGMTVFNVGKWGWYHQMLCIKDIKETQKKKKIRRILGT